jgi:hypothetical protein
MKNIRYTFLLIALVILLLSSACGQPQPVAAIPTSTPILPIAIVATLESTSTPDPCSKENLSGEVTKVNDLMREFDDYSKLASSTPQAQLVQVIPPMQEVRRRAESQEVPECLKSLKVLQINHMNTVLDILMAFMSNPKSKDINQGIANARELHLQYDTEIARLLGLTMVPPPTPVPTSATPIK